MESSATEQPRLESNVVVELAGKSQDLDLIISRIYSLVPAIPFLALYQEDSRLPTCIGLEEIR